MILRWIAGLSLFFLVACQKNIVTEEKGIKEGKKIRKEEPIKKPESAYAQNTKQNLKDKNNFIREHPILQKPDQEDSRLWLEEVQGEKALEQVHTWNAKTLETLQKDPRYQQSYETELKILNDKDRIVYGSYHNGWVWNFWQDAEKHIRGIYRQTSLESYLSGNPKWETVIDIDALAKKEKRNWVYKGMQCFSKGRAPLSNCLLSLSDGGKDAKVIREFNIQTKTFVKNGFTLKEAKSSISWLDRDHLLVATDYGADSFTESGYPRIVKLWKRGTPLSEAKTIFTGKKSDVSISGWVLDREEENKPAIAIINEGNTFYKGKSWWMRGEKDLVRFPIPERASIMGSYQGQMLLSLAEDWRGFEKGALLSFSLDDFLATGDIHSVKLVYAPHERAFIRSTQITKSGLLIAIYENVRGSLYRFNYTDGNWSSEKVPLPEKSESLRVVSANKFENIVFLTTTGFLQPTTLWSLDVTKAGGTNVQQEKLKQIDQATSWFDTEKYEVRQKEAVSRDGTKIPYFIVHKKDMPLNGENPVLLYGYGGFEIPMLSGYSATLGKLWLDKGGVYVLANIRGGGEFGPKWHQAGLKTKRQVIYDDFIAVAEDLITGKVTTPAKLAIQGGSNGGLLMGVMYTQRPDLWGAVVCAVPLLDMLRYHKLLAGASWVGEYGSPEIKEEREFLEKISPYHNLRANIKYPKILFLTSTKDDRVHPGHARKMAKLIEENGFPFRYYENIDGGHAASANYKGLARKTALQYVFLYRNIMDSPRVENTSE